MRETHFRAFFSEKHNTQAIKTTSKTTGQTIESANKLATLKYKKSSKTAHSLTCL
jgi:hypothetical protein